MDRNEELWQVYDRNGQPVEDAGRVKSEFISGEIFCGASHVWIWRDREGYKEVLLQKRAEDKIVFPGYWDISAAGHVDLGENFIEAAVREAKEEIDLDIDGSKLDFIFATREFIDQQKYHEIKFVFLYGVRGDFEVVLNDGEVSGAKWVSVDELKRIVANGENIVPHSRTYYSQLFQQLELA